MLVLLWVPVDWIVCSSCIFEPKRLAHSSNVQIKKITIYNNNNCCAIFLNNFGAAHWRKLNVLFLLPTVFHLSTSGLSRYNWLQLMIVNNKLPCASIIVCLFLIVQDVLVKGATEWLSNVLKVRPLREKIMFERWAPPLPPCLLRSTLC